MTVRAYHWVTLNGNPTLGLPGGFSWRPLTSEPAGLVFTRPSLFQLHPTLTGSGQAHKGGMRKAVLQSLALRCSDSSGQVPQHLAVTCDSTRLGLLQVECKKSRCCVQDGLWVSPKVHPVSSTERDSVGGKGVSQYVYIFDKYILARMALLNLSLHAPAQSF